jgi:hypothetical protein
MDHSALCGVFRLAVQAHAAQLARLEKLLDKARAEFDDPVDFEGVGGPVSQPWKSRPPKNSAKAKPAG